MATPDPIWTMPTWVDNWRANVLSRIATAEGAEHGVQVSSGPLSEAELEPEVIALLRVRSTDEVATLGSGGNANSRNEEEYVVEGAIRTTAAVGEDGTEAAIKEARDRAAELLGYVEREIRENPKQGLTNPSFRSAVVTRKELDQLLSPDGTYKVAVINWDCTVKVRTSVS